MTAHAVIVDEVTRLVSAIHGEVTDPALKDRLRVITLDIAAAAIRARNGENVDSSFRALTAEAENISAALAIRSAIATENCALNIIVRLLGALVGAAI